MKGIQIDFGDNNNPREKFISWERIIVDRGSVYSVSVGEVFCREDIKKFLEKTKKLKKHHKATHHSFAARISKDNMIFETKGDDGETGAGNVILRIMQRKEFINTAVCVTRWFGGVMLHRDRFTHIQEATIFGLENV